MRSCKSVRRSGKTNNAQHNTALHLTPALSPSPRETERGIERQRATNWSPVLFLAIGVHNGRVMKLASFEALEAADRLQDRIDIEHLRMRLEDNDEE